VFNAPMKAATSTDSRAGTPLVRLGKGTLLLTILIVVPSVGFMIWTEVYPAWWLHRCVDSYIPSVQDRLGFKLGLLSLPDSGDKRFGLAEVIPKGPMATAGFRSGDIPVAYHGGMNDFCGALESTSDPEGYTRVDVVNVADWHLDYGTEGRRRELRIPKGNWEKGAGR